MEFPAMLYIQYSEPASNSRLEAHRAASDCNDDYPVATYELKQVGRVKKDIVFVADPPRRYPEHGG
jgi:hypothetical protein